MLDSLHFFSQKSARSAAHVVYHISYMGTALREPNNYDERGIVLRESVRCGSFAACVF